MPGLHLDDLVTDLALSTRDYYLNVYNIEETAGGLKQPLACFKKKGQHSEKSAFVVKSNTVQSIEGTIFAENGQVGQELFTALQKVEFFFIILIDDSYPEDLQIGEYVYQDLDEAKEYAKQSLIKF